MIEEQKQMDYEQEEEEKGREEVKRNNLKRLMDWQTRQRGIVNKNNNDYRKYAWGVDQSKV